MKRILKLVFIILPVVIFEYFTWILPYAIKKDKLPLELRFYKSQKLITFVLKTLGTDFLLENCSDIYKDNPNSFFAVCNHQSNVDPLLLISRAKRPIAFIGKIEIRHFPFVGKIFYIIDGEFINRKDIKSQIKILMKVEEDLKNNKHDWVVFPEGTRNRQPFTQDLLEFHAGSFKIPLKTDANIVVFSTFGTFRPLKLLKYFKGNLPVQLKYICTIKNQDIKNKSTTELSAYTKEIIYKNVLVLREKDQDYMKLIGYKNQF